MNFSLPIYGCLTAKIFTAENAEVLPQRTQRFYRRERGGFTAENAKVSAKSAKVFLCALCGSSSAFSAVKKTSAVKTKKGPCSHTALRILS